MGREHKQPLGAGLGKGEGMAKKKKRSPDFQLIKLSRQGVDEGTAATLQLVEIADGQTFVHFSQFVQVKNFELSQR